VRVTACPAPKGASRAMIRPQLAGRDAQAGPAAADQVPSRCAVSLRVTMPRCRRIGAAGQVARAADHPVGPAGVDGRRNRVRSARAPCPPPGGHLPPGRRARAQQSELGQASHRRVQNVQAFAAATPASAAAWPACSTSSSLARPIGHAHRPLSKTFQQAPRLTIAAGIGAFLGTQKLALPRGSYQTQRPRRVRACQPHPR